MPVLKKAVVALVLLLPLAAWAFVKPVRVLAPQLEGLTCEGSVCLDDPSRRAVAQTLYRDALQDVQSSLGPLQSEPRAVFCSTPECSDKFGFHRQNAYNVGTFAVVISHRGWQPYLVRHELIHHLQSERLGSIRNWLFKPTWFREGMAYSLSGDPRRPLPEPLEGYRSHFESWFKEVGSEAMWLEAEQL